MRTCKEDNCPNNVFGGNYCLRHQWKRTDKLNKPKNKPSVPLTPQKRYIIPKQSETRLKEINEYAQHCKELEQENRAKNNGNIYCFFTGKEITAERISWHHTNKRTGDFYLDKRWLVPSINEYHLMYHQTPVEKLSKESWYYKVFLKNLGELSQELLLKEKKKFEKSGILFAY